MPAVGEAILLHRRGDIMTPQQGDLFPDGEEARRARDEGMDRVARNAGEDFTRRVRSHFQTHFQTGRHVTGEMVKLSCVRAGIEPHHHNAWGPVIKSLIVSGLLRKTGHTVLMKTRQSHARRNPLYVVAL